MAIQFARARYISRSSGGSAVRSAAYNGRDSLVAERTGELFHFRHRDAPAHHEVLLPEGAATRFAQSGELWNAAEAAERRRDAQVAREIVLALPADQAVSAEDRVELARTFAEAHFVSQGLAVQLDVHAPHETSEGEASERANWHAHLLISTRRLEGEAFAAKKARELDPTVRRGAGGRAVVAEGEAWGALWREHQDRYFAAHGLDVRVDAPASHPGEHIGPVRMRRAGSAAVERATVLREANGEAARDPEQVLAALTRGNATFTERDLDRHLAKQLGEGAEVERAVVKAAVLGRADVLTLHERDSGAATGRYTTRAVREQEQAALADAAALTQVRHHGAADLLVRTVREVRHGLRPDQAAALEHAGQAGGLAIVEGRAGTGKSHTLRAVREMWACSGKRVVGLAPTNSVAQDLGADGFTEARTVHSELFRLKSGRSVWDRDTVVVVDEAAMLDSRVLGAVLSEARISGARLILAGDDRQLASIERGGLFTELRQRHGSAEITEVTRQRADWQRQASRDLAAGRFGAAVGAFEAHGAISWSADGDAAQAALVARWRSDTAAEPGASRFVFAYTNREVDALNAALREVRRERGELGGADVRLETKHGAAAFAVGDRVQLTDTDKRVGLFNGQVGTITGLDGGSGQVTARLDAAGGQVGREVSWSAGEFGGFRHGYAGTIYKGQGKTLDRTYLLHGAHWRSASSYVALTRQRESAVVFVSREAARDAGELARQMGRVEERRASVAWASAEELWPERRREAVAKPKPRSAPERPAVGGIGVNPEQAPHGWLLPPQVRTDGRDSLGRGTDATSVRRVVEADPQVRRERQTLQDHLVRAYRDPGGAAQRLAVLVERDGWSSASARLGADPEQLGRLLGREGLLATRGTRRDRTQAQGAVSCIPRQLERIGEAETRAASGYCEAVMAQRSRDAVGVPDLSPRAWAALERVGEAIERDRPPEATRWVEQFTRRSAGVLAAWDALRADAGVASEIDRLQGAAVGRLGEDGVRDAAREAGTRQLGSLPRGSGPGSEALSRLTGALAVIRRGEFERERQQSAREQAERQQQRRGLRLGR